MDFARLFRDSIGGQMRSDHRDHAMDVIAGSGGGDPGLKKGMATTPWPTYRSFIPYLSHVLQFTFSIVREDDAPAYIYKQTVCVFSTGLCMGGGGGRPFSLCVGCGGQILDQYILRVAPNLEWHAACLKCCECQMFLDENHTCFVREGKTFCKKDYVR